MTRLNLDRPVGKTSKPEFGLDAAGTRVEIMTAQDDKPVTLSYAIGAAAGAGEGDGFYVKASTNEYVVVATKWATESARTKGIEDFLKAPEAPAAGAAGAEELALPGFGAP